MRLRPRPIQLSPTITKRIPWFRSRLLQWFTNNRRVFPWRQPNRTPYEVLVSEILLQRTRAAAVASIYERFLELFPSWEALAGSSDDELRPYIDSLGLAQVRASTLLRVARALERGDATPSTELERIRGIGQYTANAIELVINGKEAPLLDANMARVLERYLGSRTYFDIRDDPYLHALARSVARGENSLEVNWAILDFAAAVCKPRGPLCSSCPLSSKCIYASESRGNPGSRTEYTMG